MLHNILGSNFVTIAAISFQRLVKFYESFLQLIELPRAYDRARCKMAIQDERRQPQEALS